MILQRNLLLVLQILLNGITMNSVFCQHFPMRHFGTEHGLPKLMVAGITQDEEGFLWVGTSGGVCRFDGISFTQVETTPQIDYFYAKCFLRSSNGSFWLGMSGNGLAYLKDGKAILFKETHGLLSNVVQSILEDDKGNIWVGTAKGLCILSNVSSKQENFRFVPVLHRTFSVQEIWRLVEDDSKCVWVGTLNGVYVIHENRIVRRLKEACGGRALTRHPDGFVIIQMNDGLYRSFGDSLIPYHLDMRYRDLRIMDFAWSGNTLWLATYGQGLVKIESGKMEIIGERNGLITENLYSVFVDDEETVWIGSIQGLSQLYELGIHNYRKEDGLIANTVQSFAEDARGNIYIGGDQGLSIITHDTVYAMKKSIEGYPLRRILRLTKSERGAAILAHLENGRVFNIKVTVRGPTATVLESAMRRYITQLQDRAGHRWVMQHDSGVTCIRKDGRVLHWSPAEGFPTREILGTYEDLSGNIWCGTVGDGLLRFSGEMLRQYTIADGLPSNKVDDIIVHPTTHELWVTTNNGPARWRGDSAKPPFETFEELSPLRVREFSSVVIDKRGDMWFTTSIGVMRFDGRHFTRFSSEHGLLGVSALGSMLDSEGAVWVGGPQGASRIIPEQFLKSHKPPRVFFRKIDGKNSGFTPEQEPELSYGENDIRFQFFGLNLRYPEEMRYSYRLEGIKSLWSAFTPQNDIRFPSLAAGRYRFMVRAMNVRGLVSEVPAEFNFTINPPIWKRWWFILSSAVMVFLIGQFFYRMRIKQILAVERMRTRIAADLHDDIASSLASMALYSDLIQRQLRSASDDVRDYLGRIRDLSRDVMENIGLIVWTVDPRHDELSEVFIYFQRHCNQVCKAAGLTFSTRISDNQKPLTLSPEQRRTLFLIFKEALNNAVRHAHCSSVEFIASVHDHTIDMILRDDGCGFDFHEKSDGHGLANMQMRAVSIGAELKITSQPSNGTKLHLRLKIA
ncbi:MAG: hypothetical protein HY800_02055 [Ignavibacteriales bacterium]|nr:hypothetical protein [Ignavibacteriales bacterium]